MGKGDEEAIEGKKEGSRLKSGAEGRRENYKEGSGENILTVGN